MDKPIKIAVCGNQKIAVCGNEGPLTIVNDGRQRARKLITTMVFENGLIHGLPDRGGFVFCADYPLQGAELSGIQHGSPRIINNIVLFRGNISASVFGSGRCW
jgi:hypothetical protein